MKAVVESDEDAEQRQGMEAQAGNDHANGGGIDEAKETAETSYELTREDVAKCLLASQDLQGSDRQL